MGSGASEWGRVAVVGEEKFNRRIHRIGGKGARCLKLSDGTSAPVGIGASCKANVAAPEDGRAPVVRRVRDCDGA
jgi:hypothetical protein